MATLDAIVTAFQAALKDLDVSSIPPTPPENIAEPQLPALIVYAASGGFRMETASGSDGGPEKWGQHTINVDFHITRDNLPLNVATAMPFAELIVNALLRAFLGSRFDGMVTVLGKTGLPIRYQLVTMNWGGRKTVGWRFSVDVEAESAVS